MSSLYSPFSMGNLRRRKGFHGLNDNLLGPVISVVGSPSDMHNNDQEDDEEEEGLTFKVNFEKLAAMVADKNSNQYLDEVGGADELAKLLRTSTVNGIRGDARDLSRRRHEFGSNAYWWQNKPRRLVNQDLLGFKINQWWFLVVVQLCFTAWFLMELLLPEALCIWNAVGICVCLAVDVCFWTLILRMHKTAQECEKMLNKTDELKSVIVRDGRQLQGIPAHEVVVGDLVLLRKGDQIPADGISLGEEHTDFMTCGSIVVVENIRMLVTSVGENTAFGQDMSFTSYFMQTRQNIEEIVMFKWFAIRAQKRSENQTHESVNTIDIGIVNENDRKFLNCNMEGLRKLVMEKNYDYLNNELGGISGIIEVLESNRQNGIKGDASDLHQRKISFRSNTFSLCQMPHRKGLFWWNLLKALFGYTCFNIWFPVEITLCIKFSKYGAKDWWFIALGCYSFGALVACGQLILKEVGRRCSCYKLKTLFKEFDNNQVQVIRNGIPKCIPIRDLVVGDIVRLRKGSLIPADGLFVDGDSLQLENGSGMIEESKEEYPFMLFGSVVSHGRARMLVTAVGENNSYAKSHLDSGTHKPLQANFKKLLSYKEGIGFCSVVIVPLLLVVRHIHGKQTKEDGIMEMLLAIITVIIKSILRIRSSMLETPLWALLRPAQFAREVSVVLSNPRRNISDWLTAAKVTTIITDEINMQEIVEFKLNAEILDNVASKAPQEVLVGLRQAVALCSISGLANPIKETLLSWGKFELGINATEFMQTCIIEESHSENNLTWTWMRTKCDVGRARYLHCRGDEEMILSRCSNFYEKDGTKKPLDEDMRIKMVEMIQDMRARNLLCIVFAHKHLPRGDYDGEVETDEDNEGPNKEANVPEKDVHGGSDGETEVNDNYQGGSNDYGGEVKEDNGEGGVRPKIEELHQIKKEETKVEKNGLTLLGIVGLGGGERKTLQSLQKMGVNVRMVSYDHVVSNAIVVARECGILAPNQNENEVVMDAEEYRRCSEEEAKRKMSNGISVMVRATPTDKLQLIEYLRKNDEVVAVIGRDEDGDGVFREADVGFMMKSRSTPEVKEGAEFLLVDGTLTSIYKTLKWMRWLYNCLINFIQLQLVVQVPVFILNSVTSYFSGITHITDFVLFILDTVLPLLAISTTYGEPLTEEQLKKLPVGRSVVMVVIKVILKGVIVQASLLTLILILLHFRTGETISGLTKTDLINTILIVSQIFNIITIGLWRKKSWRGFSRRLLFILAVALLIPTVDFRFLRNEWVAFVEIFGVCSAVGFFMLFYKICGELETVINEY